MSDFKRRSDQKAHKLPKEFYLCSDVVSLSKKLLGKFLITFLPLQKNRKPVLTSGMIVETEAYAGIYDKASHAYDNCFTNRTKTMYEEGGIAYIYLCYGIHSLFNVVTNKKGIPDAILIRAIQPVEGIEFMLIRRKKKTLDHTLSSGPGSLTEALGITTYYNGIKLNSDIIWLEDRGIFVPSRQIIASPRIGVAYAKEHASLPYRFRIKDNPWTSK